MARTASTKTRGAKRPAGTLESLRNGANVIAHPKNKMQERLRRQYLHRGVRWCVQLGFLICFPAAWNAAFNGVKYIFTQLGSHAPIELTGFLSLLLALLAFTCVFGRFFCGFACAFGTLGDIVYALATPLRRALRLEGKGAHRLPAGVQHALQLVKYAVLVGICALCVMGIWPQVSGASPWVAFAGITARSLEGIAPTAFAALGAVMVGMALVERFFCQFLCPFGAIFSLLPVLPISLFNRRRESCARGCNRCQDSCPVRIHPERADLRSGECIACGRCADGCPMANVTLARLDGFKRDQATDDASELAQGNTRKRPPAGPAIRGTEVALTLVKAAILAALCHLLM